MIFFYTAFVAFSRSTLLIIFMRFQLSSTALKDAFSDVIIVQQLPWKLLFNMSTSPSSCSQILPSGLFFGYSGSIPHAFIRHHPSPFSQQSEITIRWKPFPIKPTNIVVVCVILDYPSPMVHVNATVKENFKSCTQLGF